MAGKNFLRIPDAVSFSLTNASLVQIMDDFQGFKTPPPAPEHPSGLGTVPQEPPPPELGQKVPLMNGLQIRIAATHAGIITRNNGFYLPDRMKKGASTFTDNYPKPVLLHHDDHSDPVGRIISAHYMDTSGVVQDKYNGRVVKNKRGVEVGVITDSLIKDFSDGRMPFGMQVDTLLTLFRDGLLDDEDFDGLGYIQLIANISDPEAIQKLLDGRYLTGSVGASTDKAVCSICRQDWTDLGPCEHKPGGIYDSEKCFIVAGSLWYDEFSLVNVPADKHARVLELNYNGRRDSVPLANEFSGRAYDVRLGFPQYDADSKEDRMHVKDAKQLTPETVVQDEAVVTPAPAEAEGTVEPKVEEVKVEAPQSTEESFDDFMTRILASGKKIADEDLERLYTLLAQELEEAIKAGELTGVNLEDAKLSTASRKKLAASTFCGPGRAFPVPDCAHVTAARRLIGRYKGPGSKEKILACVARKAKALGCGSSDAVEEPIQDAVAPTPAPVDTPAPSVADPSALLPLLELADQTKELVKEGVIAEEDTQLLQKLIQRLSILVGQDNLSKVLVLEGLAMDPLCEEQLIEEVVKQEELVGTLREQLAALQKEYADLSKDLDAVQDSVVEIRAQGRKAREAHLGLLMDLRDKKSEARDFTTLNDEMLESELSKTAKDVDMIKITDKLGDGMAREPQGTVEPPAPVVLDSHQTQGVISDKTRRELALIAERYMTLAFTSQIQAENYRKAAIDKLRSEGKLPKDE